MFVGLYNGVSWLALGRVLGLGARFGIYEILTAFYKGFSSTCVIYLPESLLCLLANLTTFNLPCDSLRH